MCLKCGINCTAFDMCLWTRKLGRAEHSASREVYNPTLPMQEKSPFPTRLLCLPNRYNLTCCFFATRSIHPFWIFTWNYLVHESQLGSQSLFRCCMIFLLSLPAKLEKATVCIVSIDHGGFVFNRIAKIAFRIPPKVTIIWEYLWFIRQVLTRYQSLPYFRGVVSF